MYRTGYKVYTVYGFVGQSRRGMGEAAEPARGRDGPRPLQVRGHGIRRVDRRQRVGHAGTESKLVSTLEKQHAVISNSMFENAKVNH